VSRLLVSRRLFGQSCYRLASKYVMMTDANIADMVIINMYFIASVCVVCNSLCVVVVASTNSVCGIGGA